MKIIKTENQRKINILKKNKISKRNENFEKK